MGNVVKYFDVKNLGCASCAAKMEHEIQKMEEVQFVSIDIITKVMKIKYNKNKENESDFLKRIEASMKKIEHDVYIELTDENKNKNKNKTEGKNKNKTEGKDKTVSENFFIKDLKKREKLKEIAIIATSLILLLISFVPYFKPYSFIICIVSYFLVGTPVLMKTARNIKSKNFFDENLLMTIATVVAIVIGEYHEAVAVMVFYRIGELLQQMALDNSKDSINSLLSIKPDEARLLCETENGAQIIPRTKKKPVEHIKVKDVIQIYPGERIPLDGFVISGKSRIDVSSITGESMPVDVEPGDEVLSGCVNQTGVLNVEVSKTSKDSTASRILDLVMNASHKKSNAEKFITKFARYYTPAVISAAILIAAVPTFLFKMPAEVWIYRALIFIVISCPCALVLSVPLCYFGAIGTASKNGIIIKGSQYIEALEKSKIAVFDKTGTLTKGDFEIVSIKPANLGFSEKKLSKDDILMYAAYAEEKSNHPIAISIKKEFLKNNKIESFAKKHEEFPGGGVVSEFEFGEITVGNYELMKKRGIKNITDTIKDKNNTVVFVAIDKNYVGSIMLSDKPKPNAKFAIEEIKKAGIKEIYMLTGDRKSEAEYIGESIGIKKENIYSNLRPEHKLEIYEEIKEKNGKEKGKGGRDESAIFIGDGINDAPALVRSDVGITMGTVGSDAAIEASDIVILNDDLTKIPKSIHISKFTKKLVYQNIIISLGIKFIVMILGITGYATIWESVFADVGVTIIAVINAQRILFYKPKPYIKDKIITDTACNDKCCSTN